MSVERIKDKPPPAKKKVPVKKKDLEAETFEQIWPGLFIIEKAGLECGRVLAFDGEERWLQYIEPDAAGTYGVYAAITPTASREQNTLKLVWRGSPEDRFAWSVCGQSAQLGGDLFVEYRQLLPRHTYVKWTLTTPTAYLPPAAGDSYKLFQGDGHTHAHVGYAILSATEQHWLLFSASARRGGFKKFEFIKQENWATAGSLQFESATVPTNMPAHSYVKCVATP